MAYSQILSVTTAAQDLHLLSIEEMRSLASVAGSGSDDALNALGLRVAAAIAAECNIAIGSGGEQPTLKRETLTETLHGVFGVPLILSRRHGVSISSITEDGTALSTSAFLVDGESGMLTRLENDCPREWWARKIVVVYEAGFETVPADLAMAAADFFRFAWIEGQRDPAMRAEEVDIDGVERTRREFWVGAVPGTAGEGAVPAVVSGQLKRFRNIAI